MEILVITAIWEADTQRLDNAGVVYFLSNCRKSFPIFNPMLDKLFVSRNFSAEEHGFCLPLNKSALQTRKSTLTQMLRALDRIRQAV